MHVCAADVARQKIHSHLSRFNFWVWYLLDFYVAWSMVNCGFQNFPQTKAVSGRIYVYCFYASSLLLPKPQVCILNVENYSKEQLWKFLVDSVHASVMYPTHKAYTRDTILPQQPDVSALELSERLGMPLGEAIVILDELAQDKKPVP